MKSSGNTILITGGTSGIGLGLALRFHHAGNKVIVAGRRKELLRQIGTDHPGIEAIELDIADQASITRASQTLAAKHPDLNVVVNNAGIMLAENIFEPASQKVAEESVTINLLGTIRMVYAFLPQLLGKDNAAIVNVTSALAFVPLPATPTYNATKAAIHSFSESLRVQLADTAVSVVEVAPPGVRTTLFGQQDSDRAMPLDDFLTETLALLHAEPTPQEIIVDNAKFVRYAEANGNYAQVLGMLSGVKAPQS
ncbi:SDR family oxidoreductase [Pseudomonas syringae]|uniref:SDR family oxidoreductase n=1 Tax=Pseudomonas syringae TaxID=317 RepID=UPI000BB5AE51|nr:SDR family NAD(P)-dependent oxidoreductase [Pseudomonas syringae]PBQ13281.1 oxidoreductase [Pseudomonas syringae]POP72882.1 KR domain-containing protein [Pseudomonas syringae pv. syringae]